MKKIDFCDVMGGIDEEYIKAAHAPKAKKKPVWLKWGAMAACLCLLVAVFPVMNYFMQPEHKGTELGESETFVYNGMDYSIVIQPFDSLENYGFPREITSELAGEQLAFLTRDTNGKFVETDNQTDTIMFEYKKGACDAAKIIQHANKWYAAIFTSVAPDINDLVEPVDFSEVYRIYGVKSAEDIAAVYVNSDKFDNRDVIAGFYEVTHTLEAQNAEAFDDSVYKDCKNEAEREAVDNAIKNDFCKLRIDTSSGIRIHLQIYPAFGWIRSVPGGNAYYEVGQLDLFYIA